MKFNKGNVQSSKCNWFSKNSLQHNIAVTAFLEASASPIRMKLAVKDSLYQLNPMKVVHFRYLVQSSY